MSTKVNPEALSTDQLRALVSHLLQMAELTMRSHRSFLTVTSDLIKAKDAIALIGQYSELMNDIFDLSHTGIERILNNDIGAPPAGGMQ